MITKDFLCAFDKNAVADVAATLSPEDIKCLIAWLTEKEDSVRYPALLLLQERSSHTADVFPYWDVFAEKLSSENSYQRSIGLMLLAENAKWASPDETKAMLPDYLALLSDEKPITVRQCVQNLEKIVISHPDVGLAVAEKLTALDLEAVRESMRKLILTDILNVLLVIREANRDEAIERYFLAALSGGILDAKSKKQFRLRFGEQNM